MLPVTLSIPVGMLVCPVPFTFKLMLPLAVVLIHNSPTSTILPVRLKLPAVVIVPVAEIRPPVKMLPPVTLPLADINPVINAPVVANTATFAVPPTPTETLPPELTTLTFDVPLTICVGVPVAIPVNCDPLPMKKLPETLPVALISPAVNKLPPVTLAVTDTTAPK